MDHAKDERMQAEGERLEKEHRRRVDSFLFEHRRHLQEDDIRGLLENTDERNLRLFRRIILYIDDLDRCPPTKVIEVLQAIHLLLYFNLFVVVVAVDARWVSRALMERYRGLLDDETHPSRKRPAAPASAYDYLEKIFQIPYWVRPMEAVASREFVESLVYADVHEADVHEANSDSVPPPASRPPAPGPASVPIPGSAVPMGLAAPPSPVRPTITPQARSAAIVEPRPETLTLSRWEAQLMRRLAPYLGQSPRRAKRFVNVYRLVKTGLPRGRTETLVGPKGASYAYRALLTQLAIVTGAPRMASLYFAALSAANADETLESLCARLERDERLTGSADWRIIRGALTTLSEFSREQGADVDQAMVGEMRDMVHITSRYSFLRRGAELQTELNVRPIAEDVARSEPARYLDGQD